MRNLILGVACGSLATIPLLCFFASRDAGRTGSEELAVFAAVGNAEEEAEPGDWDSEAASSLQHSFGHEFGGQESAPQSFVETIDLIQDADRAANPTQEGDDVDIVTAKRKPAGLDRTDRMPNCAELWSESPPRMPYATDEDEREHAATPPLSRR
jgi:hypothetical protein